jgi:hypothetical protein
LADGGRFVHDRHLPPAERPPPVAFLTWDRRRGARRVAVAWLAVRPSRASSFADPA